MKVNAPFDFANLSDNELFTILENNVAPTAYTQPLMELLLRYCERIKTLEEEVSILKTASPKLPAKKTGRKRTAFYVNTTPLDDDFLMYLIDYDYYTIAELEAEVGAKKNQLRNRYKRAKEKQKIKKENKNHANH